MDMLPLRLPFTVTVQVPEFGLSTCTCSTGFVWSSLFFSAGADGLDEFSVQGCFLSPVEFLTMRSRSFTSAGSALAVPG